jgi:hypothetical protein
MGWATAAGRVATFFAVVVVFFPNPLNCCVNIIVILLLYMFLFLPRPEPAARPQFSNAALVLLKFGPQVGQFCVMMGWG